MCGIFGVIAFGSKEINRERFENGVKCLHHRGPDDMGVYFHNQIALGHTRLSIHDLTKLGHQPMQSKLTGVSLVFNGEIYNFRQLRSELVDKGHKFYSNTDTEVVLNAYLEWGESCLVKFNGMFSLAFYDPRFNKLIIARDRFGIKPLYIYQRNDEVIFSSEIKSIKYYKNNNELGICYAGLSEYLWYGNPLGENTLYSEITRLRPAEYRVVHLDTAHMECKQFWSLSEIKQDDSISYEEATLKLKGLFKDAIKNHLDSDVPVGVLLSGGIDSTAITAFASELSSNPINTFTAGFDYAKGVNELASARKISEKFNTKHHEIHISSQNLSTLIPELVDIHDEPFGDAANIPLYLMSQQLKQDVTVLLQGDGGDEIFGGYKRYGILSNFFPWYMLSTMIRPLYPLLSQIPRLRYKSRFLEAIAQNELPNRFGMLLTVESFRHDPRNLLQGSIYQHVMKYNPLQEYQRILQKLPANLPLLQKLLYTDTQILLPCTFLEKVDKPTMANSIEVRVPFLDARLTEFALSLPAHFKVHKGNKKRILKNMFRGVVPDNILDGPKTGFGVPYGYWLKTGLHDLFRQQLSSIESHFSHIINAKVLENMFQLHCQGKVDHSFILWKMMMLTIWLSKNKALL